VPVHMMTKLQSSVYPISSRVKRSTCMTCLQDSGKLVLYLRDINLPKADKYGTSQVMAFLQQLLTYQGFYDSKLEFVGEI